MSDGAATVSGEGVRAPRLSPEVLAERRDGSRLEQDLRVPAELDCWPGHFPGRSILPGVVQLHWLLCAIGAWTGGFPHLARIEALKFKKPIGPGEKLTLSLERDADGTEFRFRLADGDVVFSSGRIALGAAPGRKE